MLYSVSFSDESDSEGGMDFHCFSPCIFYHISWYWYSFELNSCTCNIFVLLSNTFLNFKSQQSVCTCLHPIHLSLLCLHWLPEGPAAERPVPLENGDTTDAGPPHLAHRSAKLSPRQCGGVIISLSFFAVPLTIFQQL